MLEPIGKIKAILNSELVLVESSKKLSKDSVLVVFVRVPVPKDKVGLETLDVPKGEITVLLAQQENTYLAKRDRESHEVWTSQYDLLLRGLQAETKRTVYGDWSVDFDMSASLGIQVDRTVKPGDLIAIPPN